MPAKNPSIQNELMRDARDWNRDSPLQIHSSISKMEGSMLNTLMYKGAYRVDYLNKQSAGLPQAYGFYVAGCLREDESYSHDAKHQLYAGLVLAREQLGVEHLVAVYLDVYDPANPVRPAYQQIKRDMQAGMFQRVLVLDPDHLFYDVDTFEDWWRFYRAMPHCEVLTLQVGGVRPVLLFDRWFSLQIKDHERSSLCLAL